MLMSSEWDVENQSVIGIAKLLPSRFEISYSKAV
jgi:hypothetical protein